MAGPDAALEEQVLKGGGEARVLSTTCCLRRQVEVPAGGRDAGSASIPFHMRTSMNPGAGRAGWLRRPVSSLRIVVTRFGALMLGLWAWLVCGNALGAETNSTSGFRVMTYNLHHGEGTDGRVDLERIAAVIRQERADVVALQEVDKGVERTARRDFPAELAKLTGMACVFSNNFSFQGGEYGNAVLTRFPIRAVTNTLLRMVRGGEQRGVLQVTMEVRGRDLLFLATHLDYRRDDTERLLNVTQIEELVAQRPGIPVLVAGDFNDYPASRTHQAMSRQFEDVWPLAGEGEGHTIPSQAPDRRIDYIWRNRGAPLRPVRVWVPRTEASDHLPVVAEFAWD